jgi:hypothetical protein
VDPSELLANYGAIGVILALFLMWAKQQHDREVERSQRVQKRSDDLVDAIHGDLGHAITEATKAIKAREDFEDRIYEVLVDVRRLLEGRT